MTELPERLREISDDLAFDIETMWVSPTLAIAANRIEDLEAQLLEIRNGVPRVLRDEGFLIAVDELLGLD